MYSKIIDMIKGHLEKNVNVMPIQTGYFGDFLEINLNRAAVLLEPMKDQREVKSTRWKSGKYNIRIWVMIEVTRDYLTSMRELERLISAEDDSHEDAAGDGLMAPVQFKGVISALEGLKVDPDFVSISGKLGGKIWRISPKILEIGSLDFNINQRGSTKINTAQLDLTIFTEVEK